MESISTIPTAEKFLGSLLGAHMGYCYSSRSDSPWQSVNSNLLSQLWRSSIQQHTVVGPQVLAPQTLVSKPAAALPWLLYHHDNSSFRYQSLAQTLASVDSSSSSILTHAIGATCILGDCLEWLMQCSPTLQPSLLLICNYLRQRQTAYPTVLASHVKRFTEVLAPQISTTIEPLKPDEQPLLTTALAVKHCLSYPENLALILTNFEEPGTTATLSGCLLGAWGGLSVIPTKWIMALTDDSYKLISHIADEVYRNWAGITSIAATYDASPLDF
ncbi:MAG: hypothetical protein AAGI69_06905 [Cyanobacteria bacterium P01_H01_bin.21]